MTAGAPHAETRAYLLLTLTAACWGGNAVFGRLAVGEISPMALVTLRCARASPGVRQRADPERLAGHQEAPAVRLGHGRGRNSELSSAASSKKPSIP
jgi:hypothetical protein